MKKVKADIIDQFNASYDGFPECMAVVNVSIGIKEATGPGGTDIKDLFRGLCL